MGMLAARIAMFGINRMTNNADKRTVDIPAVNEGTNLRGAYSYAGVNADGVNKSLAKSSYAKSNIIGGARRGWWMNPSARY